MDLRSSHQQSDALLDLLESDPGRFEPTTALRIAQSADPSTLDIVAPIGVAPVAVAVSGYIRSGKRAKIRSLFANLTGPVGSLPQSYNELIMREERQRSRSLAAFFDVFNGRISELFADATEKYRLARWLRWQGSHRDNGFLRALFSLGGLGTRRLVDRAGITPDLTLRFSGYFSSRNRHASGLRAMLQEVTGAPVEIQQFRPRWLSMPAAEKSRIGQPRGLQLGVNATAGDKLKDLTGSFRIVIGPVAYGDYMRLSPDSASMKEITALTRLYVGAALDFDIQVILRKEDIPVCQLGRAGDPPRLGWNSWARTAPAAADSGDAVIQAATVERQDREVTHAS
ncbi:type VI secretion system baseplate subunit TssG [Rhizobium oryzicola]|uniref:type VI secretion system baseplate subunit TssG n=1 Tax=Rhizobium oryzicola TaxID=1232668 RepID=UPI003F53115B